jgi:hypothetical protein
MLTFKMLGGMYTSLISIRKKEIICEFDKESLGPWNKYL